MNVPSNHAPIARAGLRWWLSVPVFLLGVLLVARLPMQTDGLDTDASRLTTGPKVRTVSVSGRIGPRVPVPQPRSPLPDPGQVVRPSAVKVAPAPKPTPEPKPGLLYTVRRGESLWGIAAKFLGDGKRWPEIAAANPSLDPKQLHVGTQLAIPGVGRPSVPPPAVSVTEPPRKPTPRMHKVLAGETLSHIAVRYYRDRDWQRIFRANRARLKRPNGLREGMQIVIPDEGAAGIVATHAGGRS